MSPILPMRPLTAGVSGRVVPIETTAYISAQGVTGDARAFVFFTDGRVYSSAMNCTPVGLEAQVHTAVGRALAAAVSQNGVPVLIATSGKKRLTPKEMAFISERISSICSQAITPDISHAPLPREPENKKVPEIIVVNVEPSRDEQLISDDQLEPETGQQPTADEQPSKQECIIPPETEPEEDPDFCPCEQYDGTENVKLTLDMGPEAPCQQQAPPEPEIKVPDPFDFKNECFPGKQRIFFDAFPRFYPNIDWEIFSMNGCDDYLRAEFGGRTLTAVPYAPSEYPPAGIPPRARYMQDRNGKGYWIY